ncbi:MAG TPA: glucose 1-dehydrogenase [Planctomycetota bacterium]|nr:glucose 1-dehydrogenase [Planctomycetota bacterium]
MAALDGRTALVTGASRGIGEAVALALAGQGARVVLVARGEEALRRVAARIEASGGACEVLPLDVTDRDDAARAVAEWTEVAGPVEVLVNAAGWNVRRRADEYGLDEWDALVAVHLTAPFHWARLVLPGMREAGFGRIVNVASVAGLTALPSGAPYGAAKAGMIHLTRVLAREWGPHGITVNAVAPWYVRTELSEPVLSDAAFLAKVLAATPARRIGTVEDVASAVAFLCGHDAGWINGVCLPIDGGFSAASFWP